MSLSLSILAQSVQLLGLVWALDGVLDDNNFSRWETQDEIGNSKAAHCSKQDSNIVSHDRQHAQVWEDHSQSEHQSLTAPTSSCFLLVLPNFRRNLLVDFILDNR